MGKQKENVNNDSLIAILEGYLSEVATNPTVYNNLTAGINELKNGSMNVNVAALIAQATDHVTASKQNISQPLSDKERVALLHNAIAEGDLQAVKAMLDQEPSLVNKQDSRGNAALHIAAATGDVKTADLLMNYLPDITLQNNTGNNALHIAAEKNTRSCRNDH